MVTTCDRLRVVIILQYQERKITRDGRERSETKKIREPRLHPRIRVKSVNPAVNHRQCTFVVIITDPLWVVILIELGTEENMSWKRRPDKKNKEWTLTQDYITKDVDPARTHWDCHSHSHYK